MDLVVCEKILQRLLFLLFHYYLLRGCILEGFPNYDKQNAWLKTRARIHEDELNKLLSIR